MTTDSIITLIGTVVTLLGMGITIWQAAQARNYRNEIKFDIRKINLSGVAERMRKAQDDIRKLPTSNSNTQRGVKANDLIQSIRSHFDFSLSALDASGPDGDIRNLLSTAQKNLNAYEVSSNAMTPSAQNVHELQVSVQDTISQANSRIFKLEGKA